jgi:hypothetical protein
MTGWRGIAGGALTLVVLQRLVSTLSSNDTSAVGRVTGLLQLPASWAEKFLNPNVPALHKKTTTKK